MPRRILVTVLSVLFLLILTAVGVYTMHTIRNHSLPISHFIGGLTLALPAIVGLTVESLTRQQPGDNKQPSRWRPFILLVLFIGETVLATLAGTYISPEGSLRCGLEDRWQSLVANRDGDALKKIQDALQCCGLHGTLDRVYPFPSRDTPPNTCVTQNHRHKSCFDGWRAEEEKVAGLMLMIVLLTALWKVSVVIVPWRTSSSWFATHFTQAQNRFVDVEDQESRQHLPVEYPPEELRYHDQPRVEELEGEEEDRMRTPVAGEFLGFRER